VRNGPGSIAVTRMPSGRTSAFGAALIASTACLVAAYPLHPGEADCSATELKFRIVPRRCVRITGSTVRVTLSSPNTLTSDSARAASSLTSSTAPSNPRPALFNSTSMRPNSHPTGHGRGDAVLGGDVDRRDQGMVRHRAEPIGDDIGLACGRDHPITAAQCLLSDQQPEAREAPVINHV
jgi:hypothetical protein